MYIFLYLVIYSLLEKFLNNFDFEKLLGNVVDVFIVFGVILFFVVFWGCFGVSCKFKCGFYVVYYFFLKCFIKIFKFYVKSY